VASGCEANKRHDKKEKIAQNRHNFTGQNQEAQRTIQLSCEITGMTKAVNGTVTCKRDSESPRETRPLRQEPTDRSLGDSL
jgi:hypothetical protein